MQSIPGHQRICWNAGVNGIAYECEPGKRPACPCCATSPTIACTREAFAADATQSIMHLSKADPSAQMLPPTKGWACR
jgi:hypothetical protein